MSSKIRRRGRSSTAVHGGSGNATVGTPLTGDDEATDLIPDNPYDHVTTVAADISFVSATDDITRGSGNFLTDGWLAGMVIRVQGSSTNDGTYSIAVAGSTTLQLGAGESVLDAGPESCTLISQNRTPGDDTNRDVV